MGAAGDSQPRDADSITPEPETPAESDRRREERDKKVQDYGKGKKSS